MSRRGFWKRVARTRSAFRVAGEDEAEKWFGRLLAIIAIIAIIAIVIAVASGSAVFMGQDLGHVLDIGHEIGAAGLVVQLDVQRQAERRYISTDLLRQMADVATHLLG
jgi:choline-glycine betaine transporter